jgi:hypothetical protein
MMPKVLTDVEGTCGNVFTLMGQLSLELKKQGYRKEANEMGNRVILCGNYAEAIKIMNEYRNLITWTEV